MLIGESKMAVDSFVKPSKIAALKLIVIDQFRSHATAAQANHKYTIPAKLFAYKANILNARIIPILKLLEFMKLKESPFLLTQKLSNIPEKSLLNTSQASSPNIAI